MPPRGFLIELDETGFVTPSDELRRDFTKMSASTSRDLSVLFNNCWNDIFQQGPAGFV
jgi:hypothetical protein